MAKNLLKIIKGTFLAVSLGVGIPLVTCAGPHYLVHNDQVRVLLNFNGDSTVTAVKADFPYGKTELKYEINEGRPVNLKVDTGSGLFSSYRAYEDNNLDGNVDKIFGEFRNSLGTKEWVSLDTSKRIDQEFHYAVEEGQKEFEEILERFKPLLGEWGAWPYDSLKNKK